jgi:HlyD family secretion protein
MVARAGRIGAWVVVLMGTAALVWWLLRPVPVRVLTLAEQPVQLSVVSTGRVAAARETLLASTVTGRVVATPVAAGQPVAAGAPVVLLEAAEWQAALAQAQAQRQDAEAQYREAERQWQRQQALQAQGFISAAALDAAARTLEVARQRLAQAEAARQQAQARLAQTTVRAPADGVLLERLVELGDGVTPGKALARLALAGPVRVLVDLDERDLGQLAEGQRALVRADAWPDWTVDAHVQRIGAVVDSARGTVEVELALDGAADRLRPGMTVSAQIITQDPQPRLLLPLRAVRDGRVATVVDGRVRWQMVQTEPARDGWLPVRAGVTAGTRVIDPAPSLAEGARVEVMP